MIARAVSRVTQFKVSEFLFLAGSMSEPELEPKEHYRDNLAILGRSISGTTASTIWTNNKISIKSIETLAILRKKERYMSSFDRFQPYLRPPKT